jgi:predicted ATPase
MGHRAGQPRPSNLPAELTSFVGRRSELREVKRLLTTTRLLTLTGSGGAGKTRLALRAAAEMARGFPDGAWLVSLAPVQDPMLVPRAVFSALGVHDLSTGLSLSSLARYLADGRLLLVLDNCEHLLDACATLASTVTASCSDLHVLATSRQALGVLGEVRMAVRRCRCRRAAMTSRWSRPWAPTRCGCCPSGPAPWFPASPSTQAMSRP